MYRFGGLDRHSDSRQHPYLLWLPAGCTRLQNIHVGAGGRRGRRSETLLLTRRKHWLPRPMILFRTTRARCRAGFSAINKPSTNSARSWPWATPFGSFRCLWVSAPSSKAVASTFPASTPGVPGGMLVEDRWVFCHHQLVCRRANRPENRGRVCSSYQQSPRSEKQALIS